MKIFIAGTKSLQKLDTPVLQRMMSIYQKGYCVLVGDCCGVDSSVQKFYSGLGYDNVVVYASNGKARNNIGNWQIRNVPVPSYFRGFDFYKQKDIAMANDADYGFMIWDGESRGTLNNTINLVSQNKRVLVYFSPQKKMVVINSFDDLNSLLEQCVPTTQATYSKLLLRV